MTDEFGDCLLLEECELILLCMLSTWLRGLRCVWTGNRLSCLLHGGVDLFGADMVTTYKLTIDNDFPCPAA